MKVKVIEAFRDRHTKEIHKVNKEMNITKKRYDEILSVGNFVEVIEEEVKEPTPKAATKTTKKATKKAE